MVSLISNIKDIVRKNNLDISEQDIATLSSQLNDKLSDVFGKAAAYDGIVDHGDDMFYC